MSDVKKFTGYTATDGTHHKTMKEAVDHSREVKTRAALQEAFGGMEVLDAEGRGPLAHFLYENREQVLASLSQEVLLRKKRTRKGSVTPPASTTAVPAKQPAPAVQTPPVTLADGIYDLDEEN